MKMKTRERYSVRMMMSIARLSTEKNPVGLGEVARSTGISRRYLDQLATPMRRADLLRAISGRDGGYVLTRLPEKIALGDIIAAAIGDIAITECAIDTDSCTLSDECNCRSLWALINHQITQTLNSHSLADLLKDDWRTVVREQMACGH